MYKISLFQNENESKFLSNRLRKNIKASLRENNVEILAQRGSIDARIAHFIPPFDPANVDRLKSFDRKIVISFLYTEQEKASCVSSYRNVGTLQKTTIYSKYLKSLQKADKILIPSEEYREVLTKKGVDNSKIEVLSPGANVKIYKHLPESDMELSRRYYSLNPDTKFLLSFGNPKDTQLLKDLSELANLRKDFKIIFLATNDIYANSFKFKWQRRFAKYPSNLIFSTFSDINIYRSLLKNARALVLFNNTMIDKIQLNEALASELQVIGYEKAFPKDVLDKDIVIYRDNKKDLFRDITDYIDYKISGKISNATFHIEEEDVKYIGEKLIDIYKNLLTEEKDND